MSTVGLIGLLRSYQDRPVGYLIAVVAFCTAIAIREAVDHYVEIPFVTLFPALVLCSLAGGRLAGILAAVFGGLIAWYLWLPPRHSLQLDWPSGHLTIALYVVTATMLLLLTRGIDVSMRCLERERNLSADLFRDLQHRTANNLQNIAGMLRKNRRTIAANPAAALDVIDSAEHRLEVMGRINRALYNPEVHSINAASLLRQLCQDIKDATGCGHIVCDIKPSTVTLTRERAMLVSLLVAELMLNSTKHAFDEGQPGTITISLDAQRSMFYFSFSDNGKGYPPGVDPAEGRGLGYRIVVGLVSQLRGTLHLVSGSTGTKIDVVMPIS
jgi:two-component sensor histidine kinase